MALRGLGQDLAQLGVEWEACQGLCDGAARTHGSSGLSPRQPPGAPVTEVRTRPPQLPGHRPPLASSGTGHLPGSPGTSPRGSVLTLGRPWPWLGGWAHGVWPGIDLTPLPSTACAGPSVWAAVPPKGGLCRKGAQPLLGSPRGPALPRHQLALPAVLRDAAAVDLLRLWPPSSLTHWTHTCPGPTALASPSSS